MPEAALPLEELVVAPELALADGDALVPLLLPLTSMKTTVSPVLDSCRKLPASGVTPLALAPPAAGAAELLAEAPVAADPLLAPALALAPAKEPVH